MSVRAGKRRHGGKRTVGTALPLHFTTQIIDEFRTGAGKPGGPFEGRVLLPLTTAPPEAGDRVAR